MTFQVEIPQHVALGMQRLEPSSMSLRTTYRNEADIRNSLAAAFWLNGYRVETERRIVGVGRIDLLVSDYEREVLIELKTSLATIALARQAVRQADTYRRFMARTPDATFVCYGEQGVGYEDESAVESAYDFDIRIFPVGWFFNELPIPFWPLTITDRVQAVARVRRGAVRDMASAARAVADLASVSREHIDIEGLVLK